MIEDIYPSRFSAWNYLRKVVSYKGFLYYLSLKWIRIKYEESYLGLLWVIVNPILTGLIYSVCLGWALNGRKSGIDYFLFVYSGLIFWQFFRDSFLETADCFLREPNVLKRSNFPKILVPLSVVLTKVLELVVGCIILVIAVIWKQGIDLAQLALIPVLIIDISLMAVGAGMIFIYFFTCYRDIKHFFRFIFPFVIYLLPILYEPRQVPAKLFIFFKWNPLADVLVVQREVLFERIYNIPHLLEITALSIVTFVIGSLFFVRKEKYLIDFI